MFQSHPAAVPTRLLIAGVTLLTLSTGASVDAGGEVDDDTVIDQFGEITETVGPNGEAPTDAAEVALTDEQKETIRSGNHRVAILWHELSGWSQAIQDGMLDVFNDLNIEVTTTADAAFDAPTQASQIESALATQPEVILGQAVDPVTGAAAYQPAVDAGVKLIFADQAPNGFVYGEDYQAILTDDLFAVGQHSGAAMCEAIGNEGEVAVMFYDADFHVTNFRDAAFLQTLGDECPDVDVVAKEGFTDPNRAEEVASGILARHPDVSGIYVSWAVPAQGVLAALSGAGNTTTRVVTIDLDDTVAADMVSPNGHTAAIIVDEAFSYGQAMANAGALAILGEPGPEYGVSDVVTATADNVEEGYAAWNQDVPQAVLDAMAES
jgi:ribose transport system substrate-binding protein